MSAASRALISVGFSSKYVLKKTLLNRIGIYGNHSYDGIDFPVKRRTHTHGK